MKLPPEPQSQKALQFLKKAHPTGPWALTSIDPTRKKIEAASFGPDSENECLAWIEKRNGAQNVYWAVNTLLQPMAKKAGREDIKEVCFLHVDVDPRAGEDIMSEQTRIFALFSEKLPAGVPRPTILIFSGGGYQALWRLDDPIPINGNLALAEEAKRYNQRLEILFGADNVHNIDRILRLPGTINLPDARKRKKGRTEALAEVAWFEESLVYPQSAFIPQAAVQISGDGCNLFGAGKIKVAAPRIVSRLDSVDDLDEWDVSDRTKITIVQGHDPDRPKEDDNSRSVWLFDVTCQLVRKRVPDDVIFSILTDPDFQISESVLDKGSSAEKYALRQIARAKEDAIHPTLRLMNDRHAVLQREGGKCRVMTRDHVRVRDGGESREVISLQTFADFRHAMDNKRVDLGENGNGKALTAPLGLWWLSHEQRREYTALTFEPGGPAEIDGYLNLWQGWKYCPSQGVWDRTKAHIVEVLAGGSSVYADYILRWAAWAVQNPASQAEVALVFRSSTRGTGKGFFGRTMATLFGQHGLAVSGPHHLTGRFNQHLRDVCLLFADEAFANGDKQSESVLKMLITEPTLLIEGKGMNAISEPNHLHVIMASNEAWVAPAGVGERRFAIFDVSDHHASDKAWFGAIDQELKAGGYEAMLHDLLNMDLGKWHPREDVPQTAALQQQKHFSLDPLDDWVLSLLENARLPGQLFKQPNVALCRELYCNARETVPALKDVSETRLGRHLTAWGVAVSFNGDGSARVRAFPPLAQMREKWDRKFGAEEWSQPNEWQLDRGGSDLKAPF